MSKGKILVTPRSMSKNGHPLLKELEDAGYEVLTPFPGKQPSKEELLTVLPDCVAYLAGVEKVDADVIAACDKLKVISRNGVGIDNVDCKAAEAKGISLQITRGANSRGVAELALAQMMAMLRSLVPVNASVKAGGWDRTKGIEVYGRTLGIIGTGQIGQHLAKMAAGLDMQIIGYDLYPDKTLEERNPAFKYVDSIADVLKSSDVVSLHIPAGEKPVINKEKPGHHERRQLSDQHGPCGPGRPGRHARGSGIRQDRRLCRRRLRVRASRARSHAQTPQGYPVLPYRRFYDRKCGSGNSRSHPEYSGRARIK